MKTKLYTLLLLILSTAAFSQRKTVAELYKTDLFEAAIFPESYNDILLSNNRFTPTKEDVEKAEISLIKDLSKINYMEINQSNSPVIHKNLDKYCRQYFGYTDMNGDRVLLINCFWKKNQKEDYRNFLNRYINVFDGGSFYWNIKYNITKNKLFDLVVNGYS